MAVATSAVEEFSAVMVHWGIDSPPDLERLLPESWPALASRLSESSLAFVVTVCVLLIFIFLCAAGYKQDRLQRAKNFDPTASVACPLTNASFNTCHNTADTTRFGWTVVNCQSAGQILANADLSQARLAPAFFKTLRTLFLLEIYVSERF